MTASVTKGLTDRIDLVHFMVVDLGRGLLGDGDHVERQLEAGGLSSRRTPCMKCVRAFLGRLMSSSQWMLLACFSPSPTPTGTWVDNPSDEEYTGAQIVVEKRESSKVCRLVTTKTRYRLGSCEDAL